MIAPPKEGKTTLAVGLSLAVALGVPFLGHPSVQGSVLYVYVDENEAMFRKKVTDLREAGLTLPPNIYVPDSMSPDWPHPFNILAVQTQQAVEQWVKESDPSLIVVDVLRDFHSADENDSTGMKRVHDTATHLFKGRSVLYLHHSKKVSDFESETQSNPVGRSRGSSAIAGKADAVWLLGEGQLTIVPRWDERRKYRVKMDESGLWSFPELRAEVDRGAQARLLCVEFPHETHHAIAKIAKERWGMTRSVYYRSLAGYPCTHSPA